MSKLKAYTGTCDDWESAVCIFANTYKEAKSQAFKFYNGLRDDFKYIDARARLIKDKSTIEHLMQFQLSDIPHYNDNIPSCERCFAWCKPLNENKVCKDCELKEKSQ